MEKNNENNDKQSVSKAIAHDVENHDIVFATAYESPPPLLFVADKAHSKKEVKKEDQEISEAKESSPEASSKPVQAKSISPVREAANSDAALNKVTAQSKDEEKEEEIIESPNLELVFADESPEPPGDEGNEDSGAAGDGDTNGGGGDGNPVQKKEGNSIANVGSSSNKQMPGDVMQKMKLHLALHSPMLTFTLTHHLPKKMELMLMHKEPISILLLVNSTLIQNLDKN